MRPDDTPRLPQTPPPQSTGTWYLQSFPFLFSWFKTSDLPSFCLPGLSQREKITTPWSPFIKLSSLLVLSLEVTGRGPW